MKNPFSRIRLFTSETVQELKKSTWPNQAELKSSTLIVVVMVLLMSAYIAMVDFSLINFVNLFTRMVRGA